MSLGRSTVIAVLLGAGALGGVSCTTTESVKPSDAATIQSSCQAYCQHLRTLGCKEGEPLPSGASCETFCIDTQTAGHDLKTACVLKIRSCGEIQGCNQ